MKMSGIIPAMILAMASSSHAQSACELDVNSSQNSFGLVGVLLHPACPVDFTILNDILVYGYLADYFGPIPINDINVIIDNPDDPNGPLSASVD